MNNSFLNNSGSLQQAETSDYIAFESSLQQQQYVPKNSRNQSPRYFPDNYKQNRFSGNFYHKKFNSPTMNKHHHHSFHGDYANNSFGNSPNAYGRFRGSLEDFQKRRFSSPTYNSKRSPNTSYSNKSYSRQYASDTKDISVYLHPSFMEDPWVDLEKEEKTNIDESESSER